MPSHRYNSLRKEELLICIVPRDYFQSNLKDCGNRGEKSNDMCVVDGRPLLKSFQFKHLVWFFNLTVQIKFKVGTGADHPYTQRL